MSWLSAGNVYCIEEIELKMVLHDKDLNMI
jgi:hypothetical protein